MDFREQVLLLKKSRHVHSTWYRTEYPDVDWLDMDPAEHYLRYGAAMGRSPGKNFDTRYYLETYPEVAERGMNPLLHYVLEGRDKGYACRRDSGTAVLRRLQIIRKRLFGLGFTRQPLADLEQIATTSHVPAARTAAARELAAWHMQERTPEGFRAALEKLALARAGDPDLGTRCKLATTELLCHHFLDDPEAGLALFERASASGEVSADLLLARANFQEAPEARCVWINQALAWYGLPAVSLLPDESLQPYDRLTTRTSLPEVREGPKLTVLLAAYDAAGTLPTALRSLQAQTWKNLEILVIDDCSPDDGATCAVAERFAAEDPRIRLIRMPENGGAYVARNRGLDEATGEFVTIHDADDWSHPVKIETQIRFLEDHPEVMGCTSEQARTLEDLSFTKIRGSGGFVTFNTSSFLYRREPVQDALGYWDTARFAADNEFIRRMQIVFGREAFQKIPTGPLSFQRDSESSVTTDPVMGLGGSYFGARKEYFDAQAHHHRSGRSLKYTASRNNRPFAAPTIMHPDRKRLQLERSHFDLVIFGDFREDKPDVAEAECRISKALETSRSVGLVHCQPYDHEEGDTICNGLRDFLAGTDVRILVYGDEVGAAEIVYLGALPDITDMRYLPVVRREWK